jgi:tetratricopeptide (TPR) repeat protein
LETQGKLAEAEAAYRKALELLSNNTLLANGPDGASATEPRKANPKLAQAHNHLGSILQQQGWWDKAAAEFRRAIDADPKVARNHGALGFALLQQGQFTEARIATQQALDLMPEGDPLRAMALQQLQSCDRFPALDAKLAEILSGQVQPADAAERLELAMLCHVGGKQLHVAAVRFYEQAFAHDTKLADDLNAGHRYNAACAAALAGCGRGKNAGNLSDEEQTCLRQQALNWLRDELKAWGGQLDKDADKARPQVLKKMQHWQGDADFAGVRGPEALDRLPEAERQIRQRFWEEVEALRRRAAGAREPANPGQP